MKTLDALYSAGPEKRLNGAAKSAYSAWELLAPLVRTGSRRVLEKIQIRELACHSARVRPGSLYFCLPGRKVDGHSYAREAAAAGAVAIVAERALPIGASGIPVIVVEDTEALFQPRRAYFRAEKLNLIGVTGTNGKTTTTYLQSIYQAAGLPAAVVGSNGARFNNWGSGLIIPPLRLWNSSSAWPR